MANSKGGKGAVKKFWRPIGIGKVAGARAGSGVGGNCGPVQEIGAALEREGAVRTGGDADLKTVIRRRQNRKSDGWTQRFPQIQAAAGNAFAA